MRKTVLTFIITLGLVIAVGAGYFALSPAVFAFFGGTDAAAAGALSEDGKGEKTVRTASAERIRMGTGEEALRDYPHAEPVLFGDPYLAKAVQENRRAVLKQREEQEAARTEAAEAPESIPEDLHVTFTFAGDILFDENYATGIAARQSGILSRFDEGTRELMQSADVFAVNNEFCYSDRGTPLAGKTYTLRAKPDTAQWLQEMGADLVTLANNHVFDYGETGLSDTLQTLKNIGMPAIGAGENIEEASAAAWYALDADGARWLGNSAEGPEREADDPGMRIAVISTTQVEQFDNPDTRGATENQSGVFRCWDPTRLYEAVRTAKEHADFVIVCIHWGVESESTKEYRQDVLADGITKAGADLIVGDHPHVLQAAGAVNGKPVLYSMGNFYFTSYTTDTGLLQAVFAPAERRLTELRFVPCLQSGTAVQLLQGQEKERVLQKMRELSSGNGVTLDGDGVITW